VPGDEAYRQALRDTPAPAFDVRAFKDLAGPALRNELRQAQGSGRIMNYNEMRASAYTYVFNESGRLFDYYTGVEKTAEASPQPSQYNWEHIFAQSWEGLRDTLWRAHAFNGVPTHDVENAMRGNLPFGEVVDVERRSGLVTIGTDRNGNRVAELDPQVRGDIAMRALWMYCEAPEFLPPEMKSMLPTMVKWFLDDPPNAQDQRVIARAEAVEEEMLYFAHCDGDLALRAFVDVLEEFRDEPGIEDLYQRAQQKVAEARNQVMNPAA
jgi:hypothetical protein